MSVEANKALVRRYLELYDIGDLAIADEVIAPDFVDHTQPDAQPGPEGVKRMVVAVRAALPDATSTVEHMIGEGDIIAFRFELTGTQIGPLAGIPPTGQCVTISGMDFIRIENGKMAELWSHQNTLDWLLQLGAIQWVER